MPSLTATFGCLTAFYPSSDPWGYRRSDGLQLDRLRRNRTFQIHELYLFPGEWAGARDPLPAVAPQGGIAMRPSGFNRVDGYSAVFYVDGDNLVHWLVLTTDWFDVVHTTPDAYVAGQVFAHRANASRSAALFQASSGGTFHGYALTLPAFSQQLEPAAILTRA